MIKNRFLHCKITYQDFLASMDVFKEDDTWNTMQHRTIVRSTHTPNTPKVSKHDFISSRKTFSLNAFSGNSTFPLPLTTYHTALSTISFIFSHL